MNDYSVNLQNWSLTVTYNFRVIPQDLPFFSVFQGLQLAYCKLGQRGIKNLVTYNKQIIQDKLICDFESPMERWKYNYDSNLYKFGIN